MAKLLTEEQYNELQALLQASIDLTREITGNDGATIDECLQMVRDLKAKHEPIAYGLQSRKTGKIFYWSHKRENCEKMQKQEWVAECDLVGVVTVPIEATNG